MLGIKTPSSQNILILGLGGVGYYLAKLLVHEGYAITAIESNSTMIRHADGDLDARFIQGNALSIQCWREAGAGKMNYIQGCGDAGDECCPCDSEIDFGAGASCATTYMSSFPEGFGDNTIAYYQIDSETFCLKTSLENASDPDITDTQATCASACSGLVSASDYAVCSD